MILHFVFGCLGIAIGYTLSVHFRDEAAEEKYRATLGQVDLEIRREHEYYKNLCESLRADVAYYRARCDKS